MWKGEIYLWVYEVRWFISRFCSCVNLALVVADLRKWRLQGDLAKGASSVEIVCVVLLPWTRETLLYPHNLVGHIAETCPSEMRLCYNCRQPGHESINCPSPRSTQAKQCYMCGGVGHIQVDCPNNLRPGGGGGLVAGQKCYVSLESIVITGYVNMTVGFYIRIVGAP